MLEVAKPSSTTCNKIFSFVNSFLPSQSGAGIPLSQCCCPDELSGVLFLNCLLVRVAHRNHGELEQINLFCVMCFNVAIKMYCTEEKNSARICCWIKWLVVVLKQLREQPGSLSFLCICRKLVCTPSVQRADRCDKACCLNLVLIAKAPYPGAVLQNGAVTALPALSVFWLCWFHSL